MESDSYTSFITTLESDLYKVIQEIRNDRPPLEIRKDLYDVALQHAQNCVKKLHRNVKEGFESRRTLFRDAKRYMEINFVTKPLTSDPISFISNILKDHYIPRIQSQINSIGPAVMKLKSNKYVVIIIGAFFKPIFSVRLFFEYFPKIREMNESSNDFDTLLELINHFREMHNYNPLINKSNTPKNSSHKNILSKTVSYESKKVSDLFCRLFTDQTYIDLIGDIWTDFSYSVKKGESNSLIKMKFYREDEEYVYTVDVHHPIIKNHFDDTLLKPEFTKRNDKINNNHDFIIDNNDNPFAGRDNIIENKPQISQSSSTSRSITNDIPQDNLNDEIDEALKLLNDDKNDEIQKAKENQKQISPIPIKRSAFENYEPTGSNPSLKSSILPSYDNPQPIHVQNRHNSTNSLIVPNTIAKTLNSQPLAQKLSSNKSAWGNLKPKISGLQSSPKPLEGEEKQNQEDSQEEFSNSSPSMMLLKDKQKGKENKPQDDVYESDSSDILTIQPKARSNSAIILGSGIRKSPWSTHSMTPSDEQFNEKHELMKIPSELRKNQLKHPEIPAPSKIITRPFSSRSSQKGWSRIQNALGLQSNSTEIDPQAEIEQPQKKKIDHASNAWNLINPELKQKEQNDLETDEINPDSNQIQLSPIFKNDDINKADSNLDDEDIWPNSNDDQNLSIDESGDDLFLSSSSENSQSSQKSSSSSSPPNLKKSHKAAISPLGQSLKKTGLKTLKKKQPIKRIPEKDKQFTNISPSKDNDKE